MHRFIPHEQQPNKPATPYKKPTNNISDCKLSNQHPLVAKQTSKQQQDSAAATTIQKPKKTPFENPWTFAL